MVAIDRACFREATVNRRDRAEAPLVLRSFSRGRRTTTGARAFLLAWLVSDELHVLTVATLPEFRRRGLGARAARAMSSISPRSRGLARCCSKCGVRTRPPSHSMRRSVSSPSRIRPRYYADNQEDAIEMTLALPARRDYSVVLAKRSRGIR